MSIELFVTGDTHAKFTRFSNSCFNYEGLTQDTGYMIICGDFGGVFMSKAGELECKEEKYWLDWLESKPMTFIVVPGNHENYTTVEANYPIGEFYGAKARYLRQNIVWIERGEIFELAGKKFWCFGGAYSVDKAWREPEKSWWYREQASQEEFDYGFKTFCENCDDIDFIITHDVPGSVLGQIFNEKGEPSDTEQFLNRIMWRKNDKAVWFSGHLHQDFTFKEQKHFLLYKDILDINIEE